FSITDFKITSEAAAQMSFTDDLSVTLSSNTGEYQSSLPSEPIQPGDSWDAFDGVPVFVWPQELTPYTEPYVRFTVNGVDYNLRLCEEFSASKWESGKHYHYTIVLSTATPIILQAPTTTITHTLSIDGVLTGSEVQVVLNNEDGQPLSESDWTRIKNIQIQVKKGDTVYKTYSSSSISSNTIIFSGDPAQGDNKYYLPIGDYSVEVTYDGLTEPILGTATSLEPTLTYNVTANVDTLGKLTVTKASVNISQSVHDELPLPDITKLNFASVGNSYNVDISPVSDGEDFTPVKIDADAGEYTLTSSVTFDGVVLSNEPYTVVKPGVGWYVNNDGTFSETFISDYSIAKIFHIYEGDLWSDTQLAKDYSHCKHGLAYEVDSSTGNIKITDSVQSWNQSSSRQELSNMDDDFGSYSSTDNIHGYSNTVAIKESYNLGFISYGTESAVIANVTSSWYIPSVHEISLIGYTVIGDKQVWTSTVGHYQSYTGHEYYACYIVMKTGLVVPTSYNNIYAANGNYTYQSYFRILAF
ncbi:MAG: hypothetical protein IJ263_06810, partial [Paludibacteraceae bacterium]|nr:hypothetical protein [Paludibacteraceae bacterium]